MYRIRSTHRKNTAFNSQQAVQDNDTKVQGWIILDAYILLKILFTIALPVGQMHSHESQPGSTSINAIISIAIYALSMEEMHFSGNLSSLNSAFPHLCHLITKEITQ